VNLNLLHKFSSKSKTRLRHDISNPACGSSNFATFMSAQGTNKKGNKTPTSTSKKLNYLTAAEILSLAIFEMLFLYTLSLSLLTTDRNF